MTPTAATLPTSDAHVTPLRAEAPFAPPATGQGGQAMVCGVVPVWRRQLDETRETGSEGLGRLLQVFSEISSTLGTLSDRLEASARAGDGGSHDAAELLQASAALREQVDSAFVHFQFGDRVSQMLSIVGADMGRFVDWVATHPQATPGDVEQWLAALESSYTMDEQRARHHGKVPVEHGAGIDFF